MNVSTNEGIGKCFTVFIKQIQITDIKFTGLSFSDDVIYVLAVCTDF